MEIQLGSGVILDQIICGPFAQVNINIPRLIQYAAENAAKKSYEKRDRFTELRGYPVTAGFTQSTLNFISGLVRNLGSNSYNGDEVRTTITYGMENQSLKYIWNPTDYDIFHINVTGIRTFLPEDYSDLKQMKEFTSKAPEIRERLVFTEGMNFSFRWKNGEFEDFWNRSHGNQKEKRGHINSDYLRQSSHYLTTSNDLLSLSERRFKEICKKQRRKLYFKVIPDANEQKVVGYKHCLEVLEQFGDLKGSDAKKFRSMSMEECVSFMIDNILPAMQRYVIS